MIKRIAIFLFGTLFFWVVLDVFKMVVVSKLLVYVVSIFCFFRILQKIRIWGLEKKKKFELYQLFIQIHTTYRHNRKLKDIYTCEHAVIQFAAEHAVIGKCPFQIMKTLSKHYLFQEMLAVIAMDTHHGLSDVHAMLHQIELNMDTWYQAMKHYQANLEMHLKKMCSLMVVALVMTKIVLNLIESVVAISETSFYQGVMAVYLCLMALLSDYLFDVMKKGTDIEYEYVD